MSCFWNDTVCSLLHSIFPLHWHSASVYLLLFHLPFFGLDLLPVGLLFSLCLQTNGEQLGQLDTVDLNKLNEIEGTLNKAKEEMKVSDLDRKVSNLENEARKQEAAIMDYNRDIEEILKDIRNLEDIKKTLPSGCFNTPSIEKP